MKIVRHLPLRSFVQQKLLEGRSPESIAGRVRKHEPDLPTVSADSIERFLRSVYGRRIEAIRQRDKRRRRKRRPVTKSLSDRTFIDARPALINRRSRVGDAEADFIVSGKFGTGVVLVVTDRKLRISFLEKVLPVSITNVHRAFERIQQRYPELRTITTDNDILFAHHKELERLLGVKIYFCHPYHSWEKGTVENTNGIVRRDIPKSSDLSRYSRQFIASLERKLNDRYLQCLDFATPAEALESYRKQKNAPTGRSKKKVECSA